MQNFHRNHALDHSRRLPVINNSQHHLLLLDLDNTLTDTRSWFASFILDSTRMLAQALDIPHNIVNKHYADVAQATTLHEYAYIVETIASKLKAHKKVSYNELAQHTNAFWEAFHLAHPRLEVYEGVHQTLTEIREEYKNVDIVILTDSPEWVALERLSLTGLLPLIDGLVAIRTETPKLRHRGYRDCLKSTKQRLDNIHNRHETDHLKLNIAIPSIFAKPSSAGIELAAERLGCDSGQIIICGDKDGKEGQAAQNWRLRQAATGNTQNSIHFIKADYGNHDLHHPQYQELEKHIPSLKAAKPGHESPYQVPMFKALEQFAHLANSLEQILSQSTYIDAVA